MNYGRFFELDQYASRLDQGISVFKYNEIVAKPGSYEGNFLKYPIYLTITQESVDFRVHYFYSDDPDSLDKLTCHPKHLHDVILSLPLSANLEIKDGLTVALSEAFNTNFPIVDPNSNGDFFSLVTGANILKSTQHTDRQLGASYSSLPVFDIFDKNGNLNLKEAQGNFQVFTLIRKLILDFIFDLDHTKVFQNSMYYEHLSIKLKENFFFNALSAKAGYYYYRHLVKEKIAGNQTTIHFYIDRLIEAEKVWTKSIRSANSDLTFDASRGWFKSPENEMNDVYNNPDDTATRQLYLDSAEENMVREMAQSSSKWYIRRYAFSYIFPNRTGFLLLSILIIFFIAAILPATSTHSEIVYWSLIKTLCILAILLLTYKRAHKNFTGIHIFSPRLLISIITGWVTIYFGSGMFTTFEVLTESWWIISVAIAVMILCIGFFIYTEIGKLNPFHHWKAKITRTTSLILIGFVYSYAIGKLALTLKKNSEVMKYPVRGSMGTIEYIHDCCDSFIKCLFEPAPHYHQVFFLFTFFAMFIGIFLQLVSQEKPATESL